MNDQQSSRIILQDLIPATEDRNELIKMLDLINSAWQQDEETFRKRCLSDWPKWIEEQGFRFDLLGDLVLGLETSLNKTDDNFEPVAQQIDFLGRSAKTEQLIDSLIKKSDYLLVALDAILLNGEAEVDAIGAVAGGTGKKWVKDHPKADIGIIAASGLISTLAYRARRRNRGIAGGNNEPGRVEQEINEARQVGREDNESSRFSGLSSDFYTWPLSPEKRASIEAKDRLQRRVDAEEETLRADYYEPDADDNELLLSLAETEAAAFSKTVKEDAESIEETVSASLDKNLSEEEDKLVDVEESKLNAYIKHKVDEFTEEVDNQIIAVEKQEARAIDRIIE